MVPTHNSYMIPRVDERPDNLAVDTSSMARERLNDDGSDYSYASPVERSVAE